ncbi:carotenoid biosynthesis protein [Halolamina sp.]|jgi:putative membrane protein|uniref:carotenoid biosynthesis protein n=1 Tax=Halolamina sp. TaxID=1940283 RepID=UPI000223B549|nr:hypothetical protein Halar_1684 [halophilic archaeon DL31]
MTDHPPANRQLSETEANRYRLSQTGLFLLTFAHALWSWPLVDALALFLGGAAVAFVVEAPAIRAGLFTHNLRPKIVGVPMTILLAWPAVVYPAVRVAEWLVTGAVAVAVVAAALATLADAVADPPAVADGAWAYHAEWIPGPWFRGVPWWNFAGWFVVVFVTAMLPSWL